jgi:hypothetical protein
VRQPNTIIPSLIEAIVFAPSNTVLSACLETVPKMGASNTVIFVENEGHQNAL